MLRLKIAKRSSKTNVIHVGTALRTDERKQLPLMPNHVRYHEMVSKAVFYDSY